MASNDNRAAYSEASHAFLLKDWDTARKIVDDLLQKTEDNTLNDDELARKVWILQLTLLASSIDLETADPASVEQPLVQTYARIQRYYTASASSQVLHPSLLVATSLAGIKLQQPHFVRRTLEDYFDALLCCEEDVDSEALLNESITGMDTSNADLTLSGIAINGNGHSVSATTGNRQGWRKSLDRLARIYTVHLLGKTLGEWEEAKAWVAQQRCLEDAGVAVITEENAQGILTEIEDAKQAQEKEREAQLALMKEREVQAKANTERQRKASDDSKKRKSTSPLSSQASTSRARPSSSAGPSQQPQVLPSTSTSRHKPNLSISTPSHPQETGFAALRTHLSSFLSTQIHNPSSSSSAPTLRNSSSSLRILMLFLKRLAFSKMFNTILVFFLLVGAWRRRLGRSGSLCGNEVGKYWKKVREKVLETVKMGGSLGYL